jgi:hypothetical protein
MTISSEFDPGREEAIEESGNVTDELKRKASELTESAVTAAKRQVRQVASATSSTASQVGDKVSSALRDQKATGADYLGKVAGAIHRSADAFAEEVPAAARYIHQAGDQVEALAGAVRDSSPREMLDEVQAFARRQPALFFGGALVLGFAALRFLKSAPPKGSSFVIGDKNVAD